MLLKDIIAQEAIVTTLVVFIVTIIMVVSSCIVGLISPGLLFILGLKLERSPVIGIFIAVKHLLFPNKLEFLLLKDVLVADSVV